VVGLGPGDPDHLTVAARRALERAEVVWVRTNRHPSVAAVPPHVLVRTFDHLYEAHDTFAAVYQAIADTLLAAAAAGPVTYAVPGDPAVGETSVLLLRRAAAAAGVPLVELPGVSFVGPTLAAVGWDALDGVQLADATELANRHHPGIDPDRPALVAQVYGRLVAADLKLTLLNQYPPEHPVTLVAGAGTGSPRVTTLPLHDLDRRDDLDDLSTLAVPALPRPGSVLSLAEVVAHLRAPDGCPWDREQTHQSLRPFLLEEAYEVLAALDADDMDGLCEELGDLLLQVVLHAQLAAEDGDFGLTDVVRHISEKLVRRHPHVFGDTQVATSDEVRANWDALKQVERQAKGEADPFAGVPGTLPALARAQAVRRKSGAAALPTDPGPLAALGDDPVTPAERAARIGDALWAVAALADGWGVDAETALREAVARFEDGVRGGGGPARAAVRAPAAVEGAP
jgi:tetrapyrrole methylase family protein/MazG family protein